MVTRPLPVARACSLFIALGITFASEALFSRATADPAPSATNSGNVAHGLIGYYYLPSSHGYVLDQHGLPVPQKGPDATRVDPQIAFGRGKGFAKDPKQGQRIWWVPAREQGVAAIWKGYVRLPKAGTYYFTTVSDDGSSVYLNHSRVALNVHFGGALPSEAFTYADPGAPVAINPPQNTYLVPVTVTGPRVLPIEVRYLAQNASSVHGFGIDLYWVRPDGTRDPSGKPVAELVPTTALLTEPPSPIQLAVVSRAHSTISSDFLYLPMDQDVVATLTIRLADQHGRPVAGRRVHVSGLTDYGQLDRITQPERPTDENGITTATVKASAVKHSTTFFATDLADLVDVAHSAEMTIVKSPKVSFLPPAYSPYYDPKHFQVSPMPLRVGQRTTISVPLMNHQKLPAQVRVRFLSNEPNIGLANWTPIGESETVVLQPGETRVVSIGWTPTTPSPHLCFKIEVWGNVGQRANAGFWSSVSKAYATEPQRPSIEKPLESRQQNVGRVCQIPKATPQPSPTPTEQTPKKRGFVFAESEGAVSRGQPSNGSDVLYTWPAGSRLTFTDVVSNKAGDTEWYYVKQYGKEGWVSADQVTPRRPAFPPVIRPFKLKDTGLGLKRNDASCGGARG